jgi:signal transduction histidine kinase
LLRLARIERKLNHADNALAAYADLARVSDVRVSGLPADLVARRARCGCSSSSDGPRLSATKRGLCRPTSWPARWPIDRGTFAAYSEQLAGWLGTAPALPPDRDALSAAAEWIWQQWTDANGREFQTAGRRARRFGAVSVVVLWQPLGDRLVVLLTGPQFQQREWFQAPQSALDARGLRVTLADDDGQAVLGTVASADTPAVEQRAAALTHLPWTVFVGSADNNADLDEIAGRRRLLLAGLALLVGLVVAGGYVIVRAVSREFAVAQLQSDFVAAVSHEFRTPLTSLHQFTDLLNDNPDLPAAKRRTFYQAQARATERLRRLVESLLDFGRMEAGGTGPYRLERQPVAPLVRTIVDGLSARCDADGFTIEASIDTGDAAIDVDPDAFTRAVWNLLDNAVKYSGLGPCRAGERRGGRTAA